MKRFLVFAAIVAIIVGMVTYWRAHTNGTDVSGEAVTEKTPVSVTLRPLSESRKALFEVSYPGTVVASQETVLTAITAGNLSQVNVSLGQKVSAGMVLARIDDTMGGLSAENGWKSAVIQQAQITEEVARKNYALAKRVYDKEDSQANRTARDIAKLEYERAQVALQNLEDDHLVRAPFSGVVTVKSVNVGESVSEGEALFTVSRTGQLIVRIFVDEDEMARLRVGQDVSLVGNRGETSSAKVSRINTSADPVTRRFQVEIDVPNGQRALSTGTVVTVAMILTETVSDPNRFLLPLSAVTTGQNETYVFTASDGVAKKRSVAVERISGEWAEISGDVTMSDSVIVDGSKRVQDGDRISITE